MTLFEVSQASRTHSVEFSQLYPHVPTFPARCCAQSLSRAHLCVPMGGSPPGSSVHGDSPGKNTGAGCHALFQGNLSNLGIKPRSATLQADSVPPEPSCMLSRFSRVRLFAAPWIAARQVPLSMGILQGRILEWVAMPSSRGSSQPRD